jgi:hypothetical protein
MGLPWSMENVLTWRSQYERMQRWSGRLEEFGDEASDQHRLDIYLAFFLNCYAMSDWFVKSDVISPADMSALIRNSEAMRVCRDVCNRSKHLRPDKRASTEPQFSIAREYSPHGTRFSVLFLGKKRALFDVAQACIMFWDDFVRTHKPAEPVNPFFEPT